MSGRLAQLFGYFVTSSLERDSNRTDMYKASIQIKLRPSILDPQGKATHHALENLGFESVERVRMGKYVEMWIDQESEEDARRVATEACERLLTNPVMEDFEITLEKAATEAA